MKLLYATSIILPSPLANRIQILSMAKEWSKVLGNKFILGLSEIRGAISLPCSYITFGKQRRSFMIARRYLIYAREENITHIYAREEKLLFCMMILNRYIYYLPINFWYEAHLVPDNLTWWFTYMLKQCRGVVVLTSFIKVEFKRIVPRLNVLVAPDGVTVQDFDLALSKEEARQSVGLPVDKKIILYTGSFYRYAWKGVDMLIEAAKKLSSDCLVVLVGAQRDELEVMADILQRNPNVIALPRQEHARVPLYLQAADIVVLPNEKGDPGSEKYTSPLKLFEYMASGRPIVASRLPAITEVLDDELAVLVEPSNSDALVAGVTKLLTDPDRAEKLAQNAKAKVVNYDWAVRASAILSFIHEHKHDNETGYEGSC